MREKGMMAMMYGACEAIMKIAWLNTLWVLFTLGGGVVFGWAPSTAAMFTVVRKWLLGRTDAPVFKTFYQTYKKEFFKNKRTWPHPPRRRHNFISKLSIFPRP